jgi:hypothetical protein
LQTVGGQALTFWPRIPKDASVVEYASAEQGTKRGDSAIAWKFQPQERPGNSTTAVVHIRILAPPSTQSTLQLDGAAQKVTIKMAKTMPNLASARDKAKKICAERRASSKYGFPFFYHYDRFKKEWTKVRQPQKTGTTCTSFLWDIDDRELVEWVPYQWNPADRDMPKQALQAGLFEIIIEDWPLGPPAPVHTYDYFDAKKLGPYCKDPSQFRWEVDDAVHLV